jgi:hypothetical protein
MDNPNIKKSLAELRRALKLREDAWVNFKPQFTNTLKVSCFPDLIQSGVYFKQYFKFHLEIET